MFGFLWKRKPKLTDAEKILKEVKALHKIRVKQAYELTLKQLRDTGKTDLVTCFNTNIEKDVTEMLTQNGFKVKAGLTNLNGLQRWYNVSIE